MGLFRRVFSQTEALRDETGDEIGRTIGAEHRRVDTEVVGFGRAPSAERVEVVVSGALLVGLFENAARRLRVDAAAAHHFLHALRHRGGDEHVDVVRVVAQDVVGHTSDDHTGAFGRHLLDDAALDGEKILVAELIVVETAPTAKKGLHHLRDGVEKAFPLVASLEHARAESALLRGERENFFVVISNAKAFGETLADLSAAASELATHGDDEGRGHREEKKKKSERREECPHSGGGTSELTELDDKHRARKEGGGAICDGNGKPHPVARAEPPLDQMRKKENAGHEEEELAREREENALAGHTNALEEGRRHDLHADHGPKEGDDFESLRRGRDEGGIFGKERHELHGEEVARRKTQGGDHSGHHEGVFHHGNQAVELARAVVVARNGEHALVESHDDEADEHGQTVANAVSPHGGVAAIALHGVHEQATDERGARVDEKLRQSDDDGLAHDAAVGTKDVAAEANHVAGAREEIDLPQEHRRLRDECRPRRALDAPTQHHDEEPREDGVDEHAAEGGIHGQFRPIGAAQLRIEAVVEVRHDVAAEQNAHVVVGIGQGVVARAEEAKNGREGAEQNHPESEPHHDVEDHDIAQDAARRFVVFLSETDAHQRRAADSDHRAEGGGECHEGIGERQAGNGELAHALADENGIDDVVERRSHHGDDGGQGILEQKRADGALSEFSEVVVLCHRGVLCCGAPGRGYAFVPANVRRNAGARAEEGAFLSMDFSLCGQSAQWAEKTWEFSAENRLLLCETRGLSSENSLLFLRASRRVNLRWPGVAASLGSGGGKRRDDAASEGKKIPVFAEARTGSTAAKRPREG